MPKVAFDVRPYSLDTLIELTALLSGQNTPEEIRAKSQPSYFDDYFRHSDVKTIVIEKQYIDRDYLEDFAAYYVRCFETYSRCCARLHFFTSSFDKRKLGQILVRPLDDPEMMAFTAGYCGFMVIKPLPRTVFGRTCLRTYPTTPSRQFPVARAFPANLFGIPLQVESTLPFQEQDSVVSACATSALWSVLQATAREFQHRLWAPIEITQAATEFSVTESRMIPNRTGLSTAMMADAIRSVGLEALPLDIEADDHDALRAALYAYVRARIPVIMGVNLFDTCVRNKPRPIGAHAVAITGFNVADRRGRASRTAFRQKATCIDKIYVHDDQLGPFAKMTFDGIPFRAQAGTGKRRREISVPSLATAWPSRDGSRRVRAVPDLLLVPLYHKIRIPYDDVFEAVIGFDGFLKTLPRSPEKLHVLEWDLHLSTVNDLKTDLQKSNLPAAVRVSWLTRSMPKFLWRATASRNAEQVFDILFDATGIHTSHGVHGVVFYQPAIQSILKLIAASPDLDQIADLGEGALRILTGMARTQ